MPKRTRRNNKRNMRKSRKQRARKQRGGNGAPFCLTVGTQYNINGTMKTYSGSIQDHPNGPLFHKFDDEGYNNDELNEYIRFEEPKIKQKA